MSLFKCPYCHRITNITNNKPFCSCGRFLGEFIGLDDKSEFGRISDDIIQKLYSKALRKRRVKKITKTVEIQ